MNKILTRIVGAVTGLAIAIGAGFAIVNNNKQAKPIYADEESAYTIKFANNASSATAISSTTNAGTAIAAASTSYVTSKPFTVNSGKVYYGDTKTCIRVGKSGEDASLSIALSDSGKVKATKFVVNCNKTTGNKNANATLAVNGMTAQAAPGSADNLTFTYANATDIESIRFDSVTSVTIYSVEVYRYKAASTDVIQANSVAIKVGSQTISGTYEPATPYCIGDTLDLTSSVVTYQEGEGYTNGAGLINWSSSAPSVATVSEGVVTFVSQGTSTITATAVDKGADDATISASFVLNISNAGAAHGSVDNPYTVAEARAAIDAGTGITNVYATGTVSKIVTPYNEQGGFISYNISSDGLTTSNQLQAYKGKSFNGDNFTSADDIKVGAVVTVFGTLKKYNSTYEFDQNNQLVSYTAPFTVSFETNGGTEIDSQIVLDGQKVQRPADPTKANDENNTYSFANWYASSDFNGDPYDFDTPVTADLVLYAKWNVTPLPAKTIIATKSTSASLAYSAYEKHGVGALDTLDRAFTGISDNSYSDWTSSSNSGVSYKGQSAGGNDSIQLRTDSSNSGVVTTANTNNYNATSITLIWNAATSSGRVLDIYGKNEAYSAATDLYDNEEKGTLLGSLNFNDRDASNKSTLTIEGNYKFIGFRSNNKALYLSSVSIQWGEPATYTYSNLGIRFGASISEELWNRLDTESDIQGYGVLLSTPEFLTGDDLKDKYDLADDINVKKFTNADTDHPENGGIKDIPTLKGGNYVWNLYKRISFANAAKNYVAVAFIQLAGDEVVFLNQVTANMKDLAQDLIDNDPNYDAQSFGGSLSHLANA